MAKSYPKEPKSGSKMRSNNSEEKITQPNFRQKNVTKNVTINYAMEYNFYMPIRQDTDGNDLLFLLKKTFLKYLSNLPNFINFEHFFKIGTYLTIL